MSFFFEVTEWIGQIVNKEPDKCKSLDWFPLVELPARTIPYTQQAIAAYLSGSYLSCRGWSYGLPGAADDSRAGRSMTARSAKPTLVGLATATAAGPKNEVITLGSGLARTTPDQAPTVA
jgi:hypothetical protein